MVIFSKKDTYIVWGEEMGRRLMMYFAAVLIIIVTTFAFVAFASSEADLRNREFLESYGWQTNGRAVEKADIIIPDPFDLVYKSYNEFQKEAGLDLEPYRGMRGVRYTYIVENYPRDVGEDVRANVICIDDEPVGGDIMTVSLSGFMHSLLYESANK